MDLHGAFHVYDTTLRDGAQQEGLNLSVADKLSIARQLDGLGVGYIEGGWPGANPAALWPLGTVVLFSAYTVLTRRLTTEDPAPNLMLWASLATVVVLGLGAPFYWVAPDWQGWLALAGVAGFSGVANASRIRALILAPASLLAPFGYTQIATATLLGLVVFGEMPEPLTWLGIAIIVASGLYVWHRERLRGKQS